LLAKGHTLRRPCAPEGPTGLIAACGSGYNAALFFISIAGNAVSKEPDRLFAQPLVQVPDFAFNEDVVRVFPDMIKRSVPGYPTIVENLGVLAAQFAQPNSVLYDLGASLGAVTQALRRHVRTDGLPGDRRGQLGGHGRALPGIPQRPGFDVPGAATGAGGRR